MVNTIVNPISGVGGLAIWNHGILWLSINIGNFITPTDELIFFRGVQTTNQNTLNKFRVFLRIKERICIHAVTFSDKNVGQLFGVRGRALSVCRLISRNNYVMGIIAHLVIWASTNGELVGIYIMGFIGIYSLLM